MVLAEDIPLTSLGRILGILICKISIQIYDFTACPKDDGWVLAFCLYKYRANPGNFPKTKGIRSNNSESFLNVPKLKPANNFPVAAPAIKISSVFATYHHRACLMNSVLNRMFSFISHKLWRMGEAFLQIPLPPSLLSNGDLCRRKSVICNQVLSSDFKTVLLKGNTTPGVIFNFWEDFYSLSYQSCKILHWEWKNVICRNE